MPWPQAGGLPPACRHPTVAASGGTESETVLHTLSSQLGQTPQRPEAIQPGICLR